MRTCDREETRHPDGHSDPCGTELPPSGGDNPGRSPRAHQTSPCLEQQQAGGWQKGGRKTECKIRSRSVAGAAANRILRGGNEQVRLELSVAALSLALVVGVRRRHTGRPRLPLHGFAFLGTQSDASKPGECRGEENIQRG